MTAGSGCRAESIADRRSPARPSAWPPPRKINWPEIWCRSGGTGFADCPLVGSHRTRQGPTPAASKRYQRHEPETTPLYKIVAEHLETFLAEARETHERALPQYVERELREYLKCGILAHGFLRARCRSCGKDLLVALSCKKRGVCPSCNARRMCGTAAHLTDHVVPEVPLRQWVLSVPFELRLLLARDPRALTAVGRIFVQEIFRSQRERARRSGLRSTVSGAVCFPQRFGGSMNLNVHFHVAVPDGVFTSGQGAARADFCRLPTPDRLDVETLTVNVEMRVVSWLRRHGFLNDDSSEPPADPAARSALEACLLGSLGLGELSALPSRHGPTDGGHDSLLAPPRSQRRGGHSRGFDVHAGVVVSATDRDGRERLLRYCARPPLSLERLSALDDGRIAYAIRKPWGNETHRVMSPLQFLARLAALIPPPRHPLIRFYGVFAPHSSWREKVVPFRLPCCHQRDENGSCSPDSTAATTAIAVARIVKPSTLLILARRCSDPAPHCVAAVAPRYVAPAALREPSTRIDSAELLKRVHDVDALASQCGGRLNFIALILDDEPASAILDSLHLSAGAPPIARARSPDWTDPIPSDE